VKQLAALSLAAIATVACSRKNEIENVGSDTMFEVATALAETYHGKHPEISISVSGQGSARGISELISGNLELANSSRKMKPNEIEMAKQHGVTPLEHTVGYDGIAIYVHKDNPIASITVDQLKELFGDGGKLVKWSALGVDLGKDADQVVLASRSNNSGTYEYFREHVLGGDKGRFKAECNNLNGSTDVVDFCAKTRSAIGYSGVAFATKDVRVIPVIDKTGAPVMPTAATVLDGSYPISRPLFMFTNGEPRDLVKHYIEWIVSDEGQHVLQAKGYVPLRKL
jgi:phosphate transport system substrate-binding protein